MPTPEEDKAQRHGRRYASAEPNIPIAGYFVSGT
jgi:hypothetical protein